MQKKMKTTNRYLALLLCAMAMLAGRGAWAQIPSTLVYDSNTSTDFATTRTAVSAGSTLVNGWIDVQGGRWATGGGLLTGTPDSVGGNPPYDFNRDFLIRPSGENQLNSRIVMNCVRPTSTAIIQVGLRYQSTSKNAYALAFASNGVISAYKYTSNNFTQLSASAVSGASSATDTYEIDFSATGASPTTLTLTVRDVTTSTTVGTYSTTDSDATLQTSGAAFVDTHVAAATISRIRTYNAVSMSVSPTTATSSVSETITVTGLNTSWVNGTTTFSVTGGTGASISGLTVNSATSATFTLNPGTSAGTLIIGENADSATTTITVSTAVITLSSPQPYQIRQRSAGGTASISIAGSFTGGGTHNIEASWNGGGYTTIATGSTGTFSGTLANQSLGRGR